MPSGQVTATYSRTAGESVSGSYTISAVLSPAAVLSNYNITYNTAPFTITKAALSVTVNPASSVYGAAFPAFSGTLSGVVAGDGITASYSTTATPTSPAGGSYTITATLNDPNSKLSNYNVTNTPATLTIEKAALTVTVNPASSVYGAAFPAFSGTLSGVVAGDGITASYSTTATPASPAGGSYTITATLNDPNSKLSNYNVTNIPAALTITQATKTIVFPALASPVAVNGTATLAATTSNGDPVTYSIVSGAANINGTTITFTNAGSVTIAADSASTTNYLAAATVTDTVVVDAAAISYSAPTEPVGSTTATQTATVNFSAGGTLSAINVLTQGATGLDFNVVSGGTCAVGSPYTAGQACTVQYSFTPQEPGVRLGAITLVSDSGSLLGTSYLGGTGTGPQAIFSNGGQSVLQNTSGYLNGIATDASGNVYYSTFGTGNNGVYKVAANNGNTTQIASVSFGSGIVVDGAGNIFYSDYVANTVNELVGGTGTPVAIASEPNPEGLALDLQGNLYVDVGANVIKLLAGSFAPSTTYGTGLAHAQSVAVDAAGNVYITDRDGAQAVVVTPDGLTQTPIATGIGTPAGITLDAAGNVYIAVIGGAEVEEYAAGTYTPTTLGSFTQPAFVALDPSGNVLVVDRGANAIEKLTRATPALLSFATTPEGSTSSDSPQTLTLGNDGNAPLVLSGLSTATASFTLSGSSTCTSSTNLASNGSCTIGVNFAPTVPGSPLTDAVTITDNNLNVAGAVQSAPLSGTGTQQTATVTVAPATISYTTTPTTLSAAVAYLGATAPTRSGELHHRWRQRCTGHLHRNFFTADLHGQLCDRNLVCDDPHHHRDACGRHRLRHRIRIGGAHGHSDCADHHVYGSQPYLRRRAGYACGNVELRRGHYLLSGERTGDGVWVDTKHHRRWPGDGAGCADCGRQLHCRNAERELHGCAVGADRGHRQQSDEDLRRDHQRIAHFGQLSTDTAGGHRCHYGNAAHGRLRIGKRGSGGSDCGTVGGELQRGLRIAVELHPACGSYRSGHD